MLKNLLTFHEDTWLHTRYRLDFEPRPYSGVIGCARGLTKTIHPQATSAAIVEVAFS